MCIRDSVRCLPQSADDLKTTAREGLAWLDAHMGDRPYIAGDALTLADIVLFSFVEFGTLVGQVLDPSLNRLVAWHERMAARASAKATA